MKIISYIYLFGFIFVVVSSGFIIAASPTDVNSPQKKILLYDFTDRAQLKDWTVESDRICEQKLELVPGPTGRAMRIRWVVKDTSQQYWSILKMRLDRPVNIDEYDCLSFDVKPGPGNVIPAVGLNSTAGCVSVEDNISSFEPTVIPGRWAHVEIDLKNAGLAGAFRGMRFYQGLHWGLTKGTYSLDVDNIVLSKKQKVAYSPPEFEIRSEWNYFLTGEPARFRIANRTKADKPVQISVFKKDGDKAIWNRETTLSDDPEIVQVDGLAEGEYTIIVKDKELELLSLSFKVLKKIENFVRYDWNTSIQANGKYLFPIGLYFLLENASDEGVQEALDAGFNCMPRSRKTYKSQVSLLRHIEKVGHGKCFVLSGPIDNSGRLDWEKVVLPMSPEDERQLLGWYLKDEPNLTEVKELREIRDMVQKKDPYHPTHVVLNCPVKFKAYAEFIDLLGGDIYPYPSRPIRVVGEYLDKLHLACEYKKPVIAVLQAFRGKSLAAPPPEVVRATTYLSIVHGAKGIIYFAYRYKGGQSVAWKIPESDPKLWKEMKKIATEVGQLKDVLTQGETIKTDLKSLDKHIEYSIIEYQNTVYFFLVNPTKKPVKTPIEFVHTNPNTKITSWFEKTPLAREKEYLFSPYEVKCYSWTKHGMIQCW